MSRLVDGEPFSDYDFPLDQFAGVNVGIPNLLTVVHPIRSEGDARNYIARLREADDRMAEASEEAARLAGSAEPSRGRLRRADERRAGVERVGAAAVERRSHQNRRGRSVPGVA